ncbi:MAG: VTT domain-containing protein [Erysipelotrichaceae bacterium]
MNNKTIILFISFIFLLSLLAFSPLSSYLSIESINQYLEMIKGYPYTFILYILFFILGIIFIFPGFPLSLLAAPLFGFYPGLFYVILATNIGCNLTFIITRYFATQFIKDRIKDGSLIDRMNQEMKRNGFIYILTLRAIPIFPFSVVNYVSGLTPISYKTYSVATFIGLLPTITLYMYFSYSAINFQDNPLAIVIASMLIILFVILSYLISKKYKQVHSSDDI